MQRSVLEIVQHCPQIMTGPQKLLMSRIRAGEEFVVKHVGNQIYLLDGVNNRPSMIVVNNLLNRKLLKFTPVNRFGTKVRKIMWKKGHDGVQGGLINGLLLFTIEWNAIRYNIVLGAKRKDNWKLRSDLPGKPKPEYFNTVDGAKERATEMLEEFISKMIL